MERLPRLIGRALQCAGVGVRDELGQAARRLVGQRRKRLRTDAMLAREIVDDFR